MKPVLRCAAVCVITFVILTSCSTPQKTATIPRDKVALEQVPNWTARDMSFFLHGSMSTEVVPVSVLRAFMDVYPDLYTKKDFTQFGLIPDRDFDWPIGFSRQEVKHLGGLSSVGINCAACHVGEIEAHPGEPIRLLGMTSNFDVEAFFGSLVVATFRTAAPTNMANFLIAYAQMTDSPQLFRTLWNKQEDKIVAALSKASTFNDIKPGGLYPLKPEELRLTRKMVEQGTNLSAVATSMVKLMHNMRAALHVPDQPPSEVPPASGPGRNDAFGILSLALLGQPQPYAPVKFGLVWNVKDRHWVHWDGNTQSPIGRNLLAALGLGAPLIGKHGQLDFKLVQRQTDLSELIRSPRYPFPVDKAKTERGAVHYRAQCASCHDGKEGDHRLYPVSEVGTDPGRATAFNAKQAELLNRFLAGLETKGYKPSAQPGIRSTTKYWASTLSGVWARAPYLHNGSVRTMRELLTPANERARRFHRGTTRYDQREMGYADEGPYLLDNSTPGNGNYGHDYGTKLSATEKGELIEFLKTL